ncbi:hypothetical protein PRIPAC_77168 [Pristionchus pacificus]|uniref:Uncharacterized protein n=1 Tax=Pristionchus pacificus TaxID=54126 RepID=A0A2A6CQ17_PRIPA|nr:hypothetical protein PRIPAC_77168 [Pristionchus pacificus]|eukprot:PDM80304.1 hypothetical protein PRIPAC_32883 [Pristionchus pacificus]
MQSSPCSFSSFVLALGQMFSAQQALLSRGFSQDQINDARERFTQLSAGLSPDARIAEQQVIAIAKDPSTPMFQKRAHIMQFMQTQSPSVRAKLQAVRQQLMPAGGFGGGFMG